MIGRLMHWFCLSRMIVYLMKNCWCFVIDMKKFYLWIRFTVCWNTIDVLFNSSFDEEHPLCKIKSNDMLTLIVEILIVIDMHFVWLVDLWWLWKQLMDDSRVSSHIFLTFIDEETKEWSYSMSSTNRWILDLSWLIWKRKRPKKSKRKYWSVRWFSCSVSLFSLFSFSFVLFLSLSFVRQEIFILIVFFTLIPHNQYQVKNDRSKQFSFEKMFDEFVSNERSSSWIFVSVLLDRNYFWTNVSIWFFFSEPNERFCWKWFESIENCSSSSMLNSLFHFFFYFSSAFLLR